MDGWQLGCLRISASPTCFWHWPHLAMQYNRSCFDLAKWVDISANVPKTWELARTVQMKTNSVLRHQHPRTLDNNLRLSALRSFKQDSTIACTNRQQQPVMKFFPAFEPTILQPFDFSAIWSKSHSLRLRTAAKFYFDNSKLGHSNWTSSDRNKLACNLKTSEESQQGLKSGAGDRAHSYPHHCRLRNVRYTSTASTRSATETCRSVWYRLGNYSATFRQQEGCAKRHCSGEGITCQCCGSLWDDLRIFEKPLLLRKHGRVYRNLQIDTEGIF